VSHTISSGTDDLSKIARVANESEYLNNMQLGPFLDDGSLIVLSDLLPPGPSRGAITIVNPTSEHHMPSRHWSTGAINGGWLNSITPYFNNFGISTWQFDYNTDSIFTWGEGSIPPNYAPENAQTLTIFDFISPHELSLWEINRPEDQALEHESNAMRVVLNSSNLGWKTITSPPFGVSADQVYVAKLGIRYDNAESVHLILTEYDKNGDIIKSDTVQTIGTGTSDWKDIIFSYNPSSREVTSAALRISHGYLTKQPLPNVLWIDSVGIYEVPKEQLVKNSISLPFKVQGGNNNNNYKLFVRYLESPQGGLVNAMLEDSRSIQINTLSSHPKFIWRDLGEYTLDEGTHTMTLTNEEGFNAINSILLIQKDQFEVIKGQIDDWINRNNSAAVYIFEGESDMNVDNTNIVNGESFSRNGTVLMKNNTTAWNQFDVKKDGDYKIWIKGSGMFTVAIDDHKEIVNATMNGPTFSGSFQLKEGNSRLEITPLQELADNTRNSQAIEDTNIIDSIWLVSESNRLYELLDDANNNNNNERNVSPNQMHVTTTPISNNMWSSQQYEINLDNITTSKPLMISLAEPFNPGLKAAIYTKDGLSKVENPIPLFYALKSGFYIEEDSLATDAKVVIYDASIPLQWFAVSGFISFASYILLILSANVKLANRFKYLVYNLNRLMKQRISRDRKNRGFNS
ncbi:MAG: hypothetical protein M3146_07025, partial [Thermoproteota archaeon]|nr:hypothetical protein [Thermoproteota archaeon]